MTVPRELSVVNNRFLGVGVVGCGLIGARRCERAAHHPLTQLRSVFDVNLERARKIASRYGAQAGTDWHEALADDTIDVMIVATPNAYSAEICTAALGAGKHVLVEKPMGRDAGEAALIAHAARRSNKLLKIGFNHRYHPALASAHRLLSEGQIGKLINIRARYGHGGRPGYEKEWRGDPVLAGGGELTDQGIHLTDLICWFAGRPQEVFAYTQTAVWPIKPLEDNAFALFSYQDGVIASFHSSWTQWKNLFSFEIFGIAGSLVVDGLGKSYGVERLIIANRNPDGGPPRCEERTFEGPDESWDAEWAEFVNAISKGSPYQSGPDEGLASMIVLSALYSSAEHHTPVRPDFAL